MEAPSLRQDSTLFDGKVSRYFESGAIESLITYKNGYPDGEATEYFENGLIKTIIPFKNGKQTGTYKVYFQNGNLRGSMELTNNLRDGLYEEYYENGNKKGRIIYKNEVPNGEFIEYFENGNMKYSSRFINGLLNGPVKTYSYNGSLEHSGLFVENKKEGVWSFKVSDEQLLTRTYKNDTLNGEMTFKDVKNENYIVQYYEGKGNFQNGVLKSWTLQKTYIDKLLPYRTMTLENGQEIWRNYDDEGILKSEVSYGELSIENGNWKFYFPNGNVKYDIYYEANDCFSREREWEEEIMETVIESVDGFSTRSKGILWPLIPSSYLPGVFINQERFDTHYKCQASVNGDFYQFYENGKPKLKAQFEYGKLIGNLDMFDASNRKSTLQTNDPNAVLNGITIKLIKVSDDINSSAIAPNPLEMIIYYDDHYESNNLRRIVIHPLLNQYLMTMPDTTEFLDYIYDKLNSDTLHFAKETFNRYVYHVIETYRDN